MKNEEKLKELKEIINALETIQEGIHKKFFDDSLISSLEIIEELHINISEKYQRTLQER